MKRSSPPHEPLIVVSHLPDEGHFTSAEHRTVPIVCEDEFDYWSGLARVWDSSHVLVNVEHDIEATARHVTELLACPHPLCTWAYHCHWASTGLPYDVIAAGNGAREADTDSPPAAGYLQGGEEWAAWSAIGLVKITPEARTGPLRREPWSRLELAVHDAVARPWHVHGNGLGPDDWSGHVPHHHW